MVAAMDLGEWTMASTQNRNPFEQLGDLIDEGNKRTLVVKGKDRTITSLPLGYAVVAGIALLVTAAPLLVVALLVLHYTGGTLLVEDAGAQVWPAQPAPAGQQEETSPQG
jgi:hypothetical protein